MGTSPALTGLYRYEFLYGNKGVLMQGTGLTEDGRYITIDWNRGGPMGAETTFTEGIGGRGGNPRPWKTVAADPNELSLQRLLLGARQEHIG